MQFIQFISEYRYDIGMSLNGAAIAGIVTGKVFDMIFGKD